VVQSSGIAHGVADRRRERIASRTTAAARSHSRPLLGTGLADSSCRPQYADSRRPPVQFQSPHVPFSSELAGYARVSFAPGAPFLQCVLDLTERIYHDFEFLPGSTGVGTPVLDILHSRQGVCQDFAHLQIGCLRSMGFAARYVSGYVATYPPPGQSRLTGADASHAWVSVYAPEFGWVDFDPTNGLMPSDAHITVA
jgi:transglutaminase-like putative cysteine protease